MPAEIVILICALFALMAVIGLADALVHLMLWSARALRKSKRTGRRGASLRQAG
jgi:hypothetical protein